MAFTFSVDAQEFVPGSTDVSTKPKLCTSLSVDAAVFVPYVTTKVQRENSSPVVRKKVDKSSTVLRRGRFAQVDCRVQSNKKGIDFSSKTPTPDEKPPTNSNSLGHKKTFSPKNVTGQKKLRQSFSLEYSKQQKHIVPIGEEKKRNDIPLNRSPVNASSSSGESKPIILWSSIVKKESNKEKSDENNINQMSTVEGKSATDENTVPATKKYSKNKVTRTKNVLSEPPNDKYGHKTLHERIKKDINNDIAFQEPREKSTTTEFPKFLIDTDELISNRIENKLQMGVLSNNLIHKDSHVMKNLKKGSNDKGVRPTFDMNLEKSLCEDFNFETKKDKKINVTTSDTSFTRMLEDTISKGNVSKESLDKWLDRKINVKRNIVKQIPDAITGVSEAIKAPNKGQKAERTLPPSKNYNNILNEKIQDDTKSINLSDNLNFPSLTGGNTSTSVPRLSYSAVAKKIIPANPVPMSAAEKKDASKVVHDAHLTEDEKRILKKRQKKEKRKMKVKQRKQEAKMGEAKQVVPENKSEKASDREVTLDLSDMFTRLLKSSEKKSQKMMKVKKATGIISVVSGLAKKNTPAGKKVEKNKYGTTHTIMDGNTPIRKRGKERETPKKKRPTLLKKVITAERERKRLMVEKSSPSGADVSKELVLQEGSVTGMEKYECEKVEYISGYPESIWKKIHSKKFREYCDHILTKDINQLTYTLLVTLQKFQDRVYHENPTKYKQKRRFILGLREVLKHLKLKRLKAVIIAPNIERISAKGGLDDYLGSIISICNEQEVPKIFAMNRHVLGRIIKKLAPVSVVGIFNYDGAHEIFKELLVHTQSAKAEYMKKVNDLNEDSNAVLLSPQEQHNDIIPVSPGNQGQKKEKGNRENKVNEKMLDRLYINEYKPFDGDSESDAWITDNESTPY